MSTLLEYLRERLMELNAEAEARLDAAGMAQDFEDESWRAKEMINLARARGKTVEIKNLIQLVKDDKITELK
jgi:hypothetical protein